MRNTKFESEFLKYCKKYKVPLDWSVQGELHFNQIFLDEDLQEELKNKKCLIWLKNNQKGEEYGIIRNQVYIASNDTSIVYKSLKLTFEEVFHIWESYEKGHSLEWIYTNHIFTFKDEVPFEDLEIVLWTLYNGQWNYILDYLREDTYDFDFKKYLGRY